VTEIEQLPAAATDPPHVLVVANEVAFVPLIAMPAIVNVAVPELLRVIVCAALVLATF
jgi:hypothetical protein